VLQNLGSPASCSTQMRRPLLERVLSTAITNMFGQMKTRTQHSKTLEQVRQQRFSINVWCGIVHDLLIGPYVLPARLTGPVHRDFLEQSLPELLEDVLLHVRRRMWFMHVGAPAHFSTYAREYLNAVFPARWSFFLACSLIRPESP
jgi:hypothetical protein